MSAFYEIDYSDYAEKFIPSFLREYDFGINNGDFITENTIEQDSYFILEANTGQFYEHYNLGVGIKKYINGDVTKIELRQVIRENLDLDNFKINKIYIITENDLKENPIDDPDILDIIKQNGFLISLDIDR